MNENFAICEVCGEQRPVNTPGCPFCVTLAASADGHYGYYDATRGWTCFSGCPACHPEPESTPNEEMIDLSGGRDAFGE